MTSRPTGVMNALMHEATLAAELRLILDQNLIRSVYQPIVDLDTDEVVAYEALARGPVGSALERPDLLFAAAHTIGAVEELDWACRGAALAGALAAGLRKTLFVNVEPSLLDTPVRLRWRRSWSAPAASWTSCWSSPNAPSPPGPPRCSPASRRSVPSACGWHWTTSAPIPARLP